jgi:hypothetical protein
MKWNAFHVPQNLDSTSVLTFEIISVKRDNLKKKTFVRAYLKFVDVGKK